ncbi:hypothetical protein IMG5_158200 [Ichthyophthirius multifiliis]|uniref:Transmembrane protein n=1 Tax=Ichthyophthirius multifiliis TaxID=5932 RepID=G0QZM3_ICHMU|nr:hypothetical protein IMG5_158200 [Ichthyophthirius multifiliis]EGR29334.1 hypothetical protein IMG5_158200 [Ichthyophthirius multifiliis]|eukprot:XP_004030570.1 hypothetical protein IMG5_158200 [Ichthyophthirius multifiliis]
MDHNIHFIIQYLNYLAFINIKGLFMFVVHLFSYLFMFISTLKSDYFRFMEFVFIIRFITYVFIIIKGLHISYLDKLYYYNNNQWFNMVPCNIISQIISNNQYHFINKHYINYLFILFLKKLLYLLYFLLCPVQYCPQQQEYYYQYINYYYYYIQASVRTVYYV